MSFMNSLGLVAIQNKPNTKWSPDVTKSPGYVNQYFAVVSDTEFMLRIIVVTFIDRVSDKNNR